RWDGEGRRRGGDRPRSQAADSLCRRRRGDRRPGAVLARGVRERIVRREVVTDVDYMDRALFLAARGRGRTSPNPLVGAVIVSPDGVIIGDGTHERAGGAHAEVQAL